MKAEKIVVNNPMTGKNTTYLQLTKEDGTKIAIIAGEKAATDVVNFVNAPEQKKLDLKEKK